jgi:small subunit ribosomal protein S17
MVADKESKKCDDKNCPFHGSVRLRGRSFKGTVVSTRMHKTVTVEWVEKRYLSKYERSEKRRTKIHAHLPSCMSVKVGDRVVLRESRPLSKTKHFVVIKRIGKKKQGMEEEKAVVVSQQKEAKSQPVRKEETKQKKEETKKEKEESKK